jgi:hypothetical protein
MSVTFAINGCDGSVGVQLLSDFNTKKEYGGLAPCGFFGKFRFSTHKVKMLESQRMKWDFLFPVLVDSHQMSHIIVLSSFGYPIYYFIFTCFVGTK